MQEVIEERIDDRENFGGLQFLVFKYLLGNFNRIFDNFVRVVQK